ncbi:MAG: hypothetical protein L0241_27715 [Planctomycetia bacterium]|nr:hypothetical protein [Planctomycetia bacterium]
MAKWSEYTSYSPFFDGAEITSAETEFLLAIAAYQKRFCRRYPTWREVLHILHCLGYRQVADPIPVEQLLPSKQGQSDTPGERPASADGL